MPRLYFMSFDGENVHDRDGTMDELYDRMDNIGATWYFYPWPVITTDTGLTVKFIGGTVYNKGEDACILNSLLQGKRFKTVKRLFLAFSFTVEDEELGIEEYEVSLIDWLKGRGY